MRKLEIQNIVEKILAKHGIDSTKDFYLKLSMELYQDLIMERNGSIILVGHYREEGGDLISDPVLAMECTSRECGYWYPVRIEQWCGDTICSYWRDDKHQMIYPDRIKEFKSFQRMFAKNIREQQWLERGIKVEDDVKEQKEVT